MPAEFRIIADVATYRLRRLEMANLAAATLIMVALHLGVVEIAVRSIFGTVLNLLVYLNNDYLDRDEDIQSAARDRSKTSFLHDNPGAGLRAQLGLLALLLALGLAWGGNLPWALVLGGGICWAYSAWFKHRPGADILAMVGWGVAMPLVAIPPGSGVGGWLLLGQLGLFSGVFESVQVMRDHDEDAALGVRTTAVALGLPRTRTLARVLLLVAGAYAGLVFHPVLALPALLLAASSVPESKDMTAYWNRVRFGLGLTFAAQCGIVWWTGA